MAEKMLIGDKWQASEVSMCSPRYDLHYQGENPDLKGIDSLLVTSRQDCDDLIALLQRVRERLPDGR